MYSAQATVRLVCVVALIADRPSRNASVCRGRGGGAGTCLSGGGRGGGGPGEGGGGPGGSPPPPRRNVPSPQGTENLPGNEPLSTWKCHLVCSKQSQFIIAGQFRVPSSNQDTTNTTKRDIHHLMPTHSDHGQSELDSPELEPPSVVEVELKPDDDEESESLPEWETSDKCCHWHTQKQCGTCLLCLIVCFLSLPASNPIFEPKIKQRVDYVFAFCAWRRLTGEQKYTDNERWVMVICKTRNAEYT